MQCQHDLQILCSPHAAGIDCKIWSSCISSLWDLNQPNLRTHSSLKNIIFWPFFATLLSSDLDSSSELGFDSFGTFLGLSWEKITQRFHQIHVRRVTASIWFCSAAVCAVKTTRRSVPDRRITSTLRVLLKEICFIHWSLNFFGDLANLYLTKENFHNTLLTTSH